MDKLNGNNGERAISRTGTNSGKNQARILLTTRQSTPYMVHQILTIIRKA